MSNQVLEQHIVITPSIAGGKPHIAEHRITVQNIDEICEEYDLTLVEVYSPLAYYFDHRETIDRSIAERFVKNLRKNTPSMLEKKLKTNE